MDTPSGDRSGRRLEWVNFWYAVWLGTIVAGGVFGAVLMGGIKPPAGALIGLVTGVISAALFGIPVIGTTAVVAWALWLSRFRIPVAATGGGLTFFVAMWSASEYRPLVLLGAIATGAVGGVVAAEIHRRKIALPGGQASVGPSRPWQFSLRDLFVRIAVLAATLSVWIWLIRSWLWTLRAL
jgi:hypothetical protein